jgi:hypothetical protein
VEWGLLNRGYWVNGLIEKTDGVELVGWLCYQNEIADWGSLKGI